MEEEPTKMFWKLDNIIVKESAVYQEVSLYYIKDVTNIVFLCPCVTQTYTYTDVSICGRCINTG